MVSKTVLCIWTFAFLCGQIDIANGIYCTRFLESDLYCPDDCCGDDDYRYCCSPGMSGGAIAGLVIGLVIVTVVIILIYYCCRRRRVFIHTAVAQPQGPSVTVVSTQQSSAVQPAPVYPQYPQPAPQYPQPAPQYPQPVPQYPQPTPPGPSAGVQQPPPYTETGQKY